MRTILIIGTTYVRKLNKGVGELTKESVTIVGATKGRVVLLLLKSNGTYRVIEQAHDFFVARHVSENYEIIRP